MKLLKRLINYFKKVKPEKKYYVCCPKCKMAFSPWFVTGHGGLMYCYYN